MYSLCRNVVCLIQKYKPRIIIITVIFSQFIWAFLLWNTSLLLPKYPWKLEELLGLDFWVEHHMPLSVWELCINPVTWTSHGSGILVPLGCSQNHLPSAQPRWDGIDMEGSGFVGSERKIVRLMGYSWFTSGGGFARLLSQFTLSVWGLLLIYFMIYKCLWYSGKGTRYRVEYKTQLLSIPGTYSLVEGKRLWKC